MRKQPTSPIKASQNVQIGVGVDRGELEDLVEGLVGAGGCNSVEDKPHPMPLIRR